MPTVNKVHASEHVLHTQSQSPRWSVQQRESWINSALAAATQSLRDNQQALAVESQGSATDEERPDD